jgi:hypothetical protein
MSKSYTSSQNTLLKIFGLQIEAGTWDLHNSKSNSEFGFQQTIQGVVYLGAPSGDVDEVCVNLDTGPFTSSASLQYHCRLVRNEGGRREPCQELQIAGACPFTVLCVNISDRVVCTLSAVQVTQCQITGSRLTGLSVISTMLATMKFRILYCKDQDTTTSLPVVLRGCKTWSLTLREEHRLRVFDTLLKEAFRLKRDEVIKDRRKLKNEEFHNCYSSTNISDQMTKSDG